MGVIVGIFASIYGVWLSNKSANEQAAAEQVSRQQSFTAFKQNVNDQLAERSAQFVWLRDKEEADFKFALQSCSMR